MRALTVNVSLSCLLTTAAASAQAPLIMPGDLPARLTFEAGLDLRDQPLGWAGPPGAVFLDDTIVHSGKGAARLERTATSAGSFSPMSMVLPADLAGDVLEIRGYVRTEDVKGGAALWLREDGPAGPVAFDNMAGREITGTTPWSQYSIKLPLKKEARAVFVGALLSGTGRVWIDDVEILLDGKPVWLAPRVQRPATILETDHEFDGGSKIALDTVSPIQIKNLVTLGKVWGFLKYHHPEATKGRRHWDYELFRVIPRALSAADRAEGLAVINDWVGQLGDTPACSECVTLTAHNQHLAPDLAWIRDAKELGSSLSARLTAIHANRLAHTDQFYVSLAPGVGNPSFTRELAYQGVALPDAGFQILGLFRLWNIVQYWAPYRDLLDQPWEGALERFLPRAALAKTREALQLEMMAFIALIQDTHANLWSSLDVRPPTGPCQVGVRVRFVEGAAVVAGLGDEGQATTALRLGDVIEKIDGRAVTTLVSEWRPYYAASNEPTRLRDMGSALLRGPCGEVPLMVKRDGRLLAVKSVRSAAPTTRRAPPRHDLPGDTFRKLSDDVAYLKLSSIKAADVAGYIESAAGTKGLIVDLRNYPSDFVVFALGSLLVDSRTPFARFTQGDLQNPGAFHFGEPLFLDPGKPTYRGRVVILVDELTQSQAEYTTMALRTARGAVVVGSTTAGADGNISLISLPGRLSTMISGIGVFYPDKQPTQRIGILPDIKATPTIRGIKEGRDEVLEAGIRSVLGASASQHQIDAITKLIYSLDRSGS